MKMSLLEIVQDIMSDMSADNINDINDTTESLQVAQIVKTTYLELIDSKNWPHLKTITQFDSATTANPVKMKLPEGVKELVSVRYNKRKTAETRDRYLSLTYLDPEDFLDQLNGRNEDESNIDEVIDYGLTKFFVRNDKAPEWWTSFDDEYIMLDSYDNAVDDTLQSSKTQVVVYRDPAWSMTNDAIPDLPSEAFSRLVAEAKSVAFNVIKQLPNAKAEQQSARQGAWLSRKAWRAAGGIKFPDFGRKRGRSRNSLLDKDGV